MNESFFEGVGGLKIATKSWKPEGKPKAVMILVHGFNAHSGYMEWPAEQFVADGFAVYALLICADAATQKASGFMLKSFRIILATFTNSSRSHGPKNPTHLYLFSATVPAV